MKARELSVGLVPMLVVACGLNPRPGERDDRPGGVMVSAAQIEKSGARTGWEAIQRNLPNMGLREDGRGRPARIIRRGQSSINLTDVPAVILDGMRLWDFTALGSVPAQDILWIRFLSGIDATTYYGTNAGDGVIIIRTKHGG